MNEGGEVILDHGVDSFSENGVFLLEEFVARINPLLDCLFNELPGNNEWVIIGELSRLRPVFGLADERQKGVRFTYCSAMFITSST